MDTRELVLNIAVNLGRLGRWACEGKLSRLHQFLRETEVYVSELDKAHKSSRFQQTFNLFQENFNKLKGSTEINLAWAEMMFTWANILTHRAPLA